MKEQAPPRLYYVLIILIAAVTLLGGVVHYSGFPWESWFSVVLLGALFVYLHTFSVTLGGKMNYSLSTTTIFPIIFLYGATPGMMMSMLAGLVDGLINKKSWERTLFNMSQLALSALMGSLVYVKMGGSLAPVSVPGVFGILFGALVNIVTNITLVSLVIAVFTRQSVAAVSISAGRSAFYSSLGTGFIGLIFTLFVVIYGFWGLLAFGVLLIYLSKILKMANEVKGERNIRQELEGALLLDEMTGAHNFRFLTAWLNAPTEEKTTILFVDIDNFKEFNDRHGHAEGDKVLRLVVETMKLSLRTSDKVVRYGGDEFVVLLTGQDRKGAMGAANRITDNLAKIRTTTWLQPVTVSIGIAAASEKNVDKHQLLLLADQAMYTAKRVGKNTIHLCLEENPT